MSELPNDISLNGEWMVVPDPKDAGAAGQWFKGAAPAGGTAITLGEDVAVAAEDDAVWYFCEFNVDEVPAGFSAHLQFAGVARYASAWLNGETLGSRNGYAAPHDFSVTASLKSGQNFLGVRLCRENVSGGNAYLANSVSVYFKQGNFIRDIFIQPDVRRKRINVSVVTEGPGRVRLHVLGTAYEVEGEAGTLLLDIPDFEGWSPDSPTLYSLQCILLEGEEVVDSRSTAFGMREFTVKDNRFYLNSRPIFVKAVIHETLHPASLTIEERVTRSRHEVTLAKEAGFNMIQFRGATPCREMLEVADTLGMLVCEDLQDSVTVSGDAPFYAEVILRDRGHPSVVIWGIERLPKEADNSSSGDESGGGLAARDLDPSRLILGNRASDSEACARPVLVRPYRDAYEDYDDLRGYHRPPISAESERYLKNNGHGASLCFLSELGVAALNRKEGAAGASEEDFRGRGLDRVFGDWEGLVAASESVQCEAARAQIDAIRSNKNLAGYGWYRLRDVGGESGFGLLDEAGSPTPLYRTVQQLQSKLCLIIRIDVTNLVPRQEVPVTITLINEARSEDRVDLSLQVVGPTNQVLWKKKRSLKLVRTGKEIWSGTIAASGSPGGHRFVVRLMKTMKVMAESSVSLHVGEEAEKCAEHIHVIDRDGVWTGKCRPWATPVALTAPIHVIPPLANTIRAYPDNEMAQVLAQVREGAVALVFSPPSDWNDFVAQFEDCPRITSRGVLGVRSAAFHYAKIHPVFEGLPLDGLMGRAYANVVAGRTFLEQSDEDITGALLVDELGEGEPAFWGHDILVQRYGSGRLVFTCLRILENLGRDRLADRLFVNLINHFVRRSVPSKRPMPPHQQAVEWLRQERLTQVRRWMVLGEFPNDAGVGHAKAYPPEEAVDLGATYPGWYKALRWQPWSGGTTPWEGINLQEALSSGDHADAWHHYGTGYAYAEFRSDRRQHVSLSLGLRGPMKVWLNRKLAHEVDEHHTGEKLREVEVPGYIREGKNTVLIKCSRRPGPFEFSFDLETGDEGPLQIAWWK